MGTNLFNNQVLFATASYDRTIRLWDVNTGACYRELKHNESQVNCMSFHPNKSLLATGGYQQVCIYDTISSNLQPNSDGGSKPLLSLDGTIKNTVAIGFQEKGVWMYTAGEDKTVKIWDMSMGLKQIKCAKTLNHTHPISCVAFHPNQVDFMIGDEAGNLLRWDIRDNQAEILFSESKSPIRSISINQEGNLMAATNNEGFCFFWSLLGGFNENSPQLGRLARKHQIHRRYALKCLFTPDSTYLATSSADGTAKIWTTVNFDLVKEYKDPNVTNMCWVWDLAFTCDSKYMFTVSSDKNARLWEVETGDIKVTFTGHQKPVVCLAFSDSKIN